MTLPGKPDLENIARIDKGVIPFTRRCQENGLVIDREYLYELSSYLDVEMQDYAKKILAYVPKESLDAFTSESIDVDDFNVDSPDQIAALLFRHLKVGQGLELTYTPTGERVSTEKKQLERLKETHPVIPLILKRREMAKLQNTYCRVLPDKATYVPELGCWKIFYSIGLTSTSTGRMTCSRLHQIPMRSEVGRLIRGAFSTNPGMLLMSVDYSGLELRVLAHCAVEREMLRVFAMPKGDIHQETQDAIPMPDGLDSSQRRLAAKKVNFSTVYGTSETGLWLNLMAENVPCTKEQCGGFQRGFYSKYADVMPWIQKQHGRCRKYGFNYNPFGRVTPTPEFSSVHRRVIREGERRVQNWGIQSTATDLFKIAAAKVESFAEEVRLGLFGRPFYLEPLLPVHDQFLIGVDPEIAPDCREIITGIMNDAVSLRVKLKVDSSLTERWEK